MTINTNNLCKLTNLVDYCAMLASVLIKKPLLGSYSFQLVIQDRVPVNEVLGLNPSYYVEVSVPGTAVLLPLWETKRRTRAAGHWKKAMMAKWVKT